MNCNWRKVNTLKQKVKHMLTNDEVIRDRSDTIKKLIGIFMFTLGVSFYFGFLNQNKLVALTLIIIGLVLFFYHYLIRLPDSYKHYVD